MAGDAELVKVLSSAGVVAGFWCSVNLSLAWAEGCIGSSAGDEDEGLANEGTAVTEWRWKR